MFILEKPYVSQLLKQTLLENKAAVLDNPVSSAAMAEAGLTLKSESDFISLYNSNPSQPVYSNSENAIDWIDNNLQKSNLPKKSDFSRTNRLSVILFRTCTLTSFIAQ